jgi:hypothetical protein
VLLWFFSPFVLFLFVSISLPPRHALSPAFIKPENAMRSFRVFVSTSLLTELSKTSHIKCSKRKRLSMGKISNPKQTPKFLFS